MKVVAIVVICLVLVVAGIYAVKVNNKASDEETYLRIHIRANSNDAVDQSVKYKVKESIVEFMTPALEGVKSKAEAMEILQINTVAMKRVADDTLAQNGYNYTSRVSLRKEEFPARTYGDLTLDSGIYDALIIELGSGLGDNWWCVVFPPLCFVGENKDNVEYKSFFAEMYHKITHR
ncbi:MAG: stage II sporulation protein R [Clostridia bacterium]|nr:stage II sporulation protein R [Clostridia bacterium]